MTGANEDQLEFVTDRPGHDRRYAMGFDKAKKTLGWEPKIGWKEGIRGTIEWYAENQKWIDSVRTGDYLNWLQRHYG